MLLASPPIQWRAVGVSALGRHRAWGTSQARKLALRNDRRSPARSDLRQGVSAVRTVRCCHQGDTLARSPQWHRNLGKSPRAATSPPRRPAGRRQATPRHALAEGCSPHDASTVTPSSPRPPACDELGESLRDDPRPRDSESEAVGVARLAWDRNQELGSGWPET